MELQNKFNLPSALVNAVKGFDKNYQASRGETRLSVTQLIQPPLIKRLTDIHREEIVEDVSSRIWSILGSATHSILEHAAGDNDLSEERLFVDIEGIKVSGQGDLYEADGTLSDYKITSTWSVIGEPKPEWEQQLNILAYLYEKAGFKVGKLQIVAILRDWSAGRALSGNYPECMVKVVPIERWDETKTIDFLTERVKLHLAAAEVKPEEITRCTSKERWSKPTQYACMKKGRKSAVKLYSSYAEAAEDKRGDSVEERPGKETRCEGYCSVNTWCPYFHK